MAPLGGGEVSMQGGKAGGRGNGAGRGQVLKPYDVPGVNSLEEIAKKLFGGGRGGGRGIRSGRGSSVGER